MIFIINKWKNILALSPHTDDIELACGGTLSKLILLGCNIHTMIFSTCTESVPDGFPSNVLRTEVIEASTRLGIVKNNLHIFDYPVRNFYKYRQNILEELICFSKTNEIDLVITPSKYDVHQDHIIISEEAIRAFKSKTILAYEMPWNNLSFEARFFVKLSEDDVNKKLNALAAYVSQQEKTYFSKDFIQSLLRVRGAQIKTIYAEAFDVVRIVF